MTATRTRGIHDNPTIGDLIVPPGSQVRGLPAQTMLDVREPCQTGFATNLYQPNSIIPSPTFKPTKLWFSYQPTMFYSRKPKLPSTASLPSLPWQTRNAQRSTCKRHNLACWSSRHCKFECVIPRDGHGIYRFILEQMLDIPSMSMTQITPIGDAPITDSQHLLPDVC